MLSEIRIYSKVKEVKKLIDFLRSLSKEEKIRMKILIDGPKDSSILSFDVLYPGSDNKKHEISIRAEDIWMKIEGNVKIIIDEKCCPVKGRMELVFHRGEIALFIVTKAGMLESLDETQPILLIN